MAKKNDKKKRITGDDLFSSVEGKYFVDGKEILIDYTDTEPSIELLKKLEQSPVSQLDAFWIRKRMHSLGIIIQSLQILVEERLEIVETNIIELKESASQIASIEVHKIVNGQLIKMNETLKHIEISNDQQLKLINLTAEKTIYGWIKKQYEAKPLRTIVGGSFIVIILFMYFMSSLNIHSFKDIWEFIKEWLP